MALLTMQQIVPGGLVTSPVSAAGGGDTVSGCDDRTFLEVTNGSGSPITVTIADPGYSPAGNAGSAPAISVAAGATRKIPVTAAHVSPSTGVASISYSAVTTVTVAYVRR